MLMMQTFTTRSDTSNLLFFFFFWDCPWFTGGLNMTPFFVSFFLCPWRRLAVQRDRWIKGSLVISFSSTGWISVQWFSSSVSFRKLLLRHNSKFLKFIRQPANSGLQSEHNMSEWVAQQVVSPVTPQRFDYLVINVSLNIDVGPLRAAAAACWACWALC